MTLKGELAFVCGRKQGQRRVSSYMCVLFLSLLWLFMLLKIFIFLTPEGALFLKYVFSWLLLQK